MFSGLFGAVILYFVWPAIQFVLEKLKLALIWIAEKIAFLFGWLPAVLAWLFKALAILFGITTLLGVIGCVGQILIDQLKTAWETGKSQKAVFTGSFSLGVSIALILLVAAGTPEPVVAQGQSTVSRSAQKEMIRARATSIAKQKKKTRRKRPARTAPIAAPTVIVPALSPEPPPDLAGTIDRAWLCTSLVFKTASPTGLFLATLPSEVEGWARRTFRTASAPMFDAAFLATVLGLSLLGVLRGIFSRADLEYRMRFYNTDLLLIAVMPLIVALLVLGASHENQE